MSKKIKILSASLIILSLIATPSIASEKSPQLMQDSFNIPLETDKNPLEGNLPSEDSTGDLKNILSHKSSNSIVEVPKDSSSPILIKDSEGTTTISLPVEDKGMTKAQIVDESVAAFKGGNYDSYTSLKESGDIQFSTLIKNSDAPSSYEYEFTLDAGDSLVQVGEYIAILDSAGNVSAAIDKPWAKDALGMDVPTSFEVKGNTLIQHINHKGSSYQYPILADPLYSRGIIHIVEKETWTQQTHWHVSFKVTIKARTMWFLGQRDRIYRDGLTDLREHHPRSMGSDSMAQQWECHVEGLPMTLTIDLESIRPSNPRWKDRIPTLRRIVAEGKGSIYATCNW